MGSGARARSRSFKPRDGSVIEAAHRLPSPGTSPSTRGGAGSQWLRDDRSSLGVTSSHYDVSDPEARRVMSAMGGETSGGGIMAGRVSEGGVCDECGLERSRASRRGVLQAGASSRGARVGDSSWGGEGGGGGGEWSPRSARGAPIRRGSEAEGGARDGVPGQRGRCCQCGEGVGTSRNGAGRDGDAGWEGETETDAGDIRWTDDDDDEEERGEGRVGHVGVVDAAADAASVRLFEGNGARCDACAACADRCGTVGCVTCGGPAQRPRGGRSAGDVEAGGGGADDARGSLSADRVAEAAAAAAAAAGNPRRTGWGHTSGASGVGGSTKTGVGFTCCQILRHRTERSLWLVAGGYVYDATLFMHDHPVGPLPMLRGAGRDNTEDMEMHSSAAKRAWQKLKIGHLKACPLNGFGYFLPPKDKCAIM